MGMTCTICSWASWIEWHVIWKCHYTTVITQAKTGLMGINWLCAGKGRDGAWNWVLRVPATQRFNLRAPAVESERLHFLWKWYTIVGCFRLFLQPLINPGWAGYSQVMTLWQYWNAYINNISSCSSSSSTGISSIIPKQKLRFPGHLISWVSDWGSDWLSTWFFSMG